MPPRRKPIEERFWPKVQKGEGCWVWTAYTNKKGYGVFAREHGKMVLAHRISWELTNGSILEGLEVCHRCDNPICVNPDHLFLGTHADNVRDCYNKGRRRSPNVRLTAEQVAEIRRLLGEGLSYRKIAEQVGCDASNIGYIKRGNTWAA